ncbi:MAG: hypothetical protein M3Z92_09375 [Bacteroidota bacterium]|nr:hypothetical protein [Bacteroidota bacterium]MDQ6890025.1 hypothetical protein [Bacteroidota bacterium]
MKKLFLLLAISFLAGTSSFAAPYHEMHQKHHKHHKHGHKKKHDKEGKHKDKDEKK